MPRRWWPQVAFAGTVAILLVGGQAGMVRLIYPVGALAVTAWCFTQGADSYLRFVLWLWMLSPLVRRVADYSLGWQEPSLVLLTPYLATMWCGAVLVLRMVAHPTGDHEVPAHRSIFVVAGVAVACGVPVGFATAVPPATIELLNWLVPIALGWYIASQRSTVREVERAVIATLGTGTVLLAAYGMYQFATMPAWDAAWMTNSAMTSIGFPLPFRARVFSTMHSPGVLGFFVLVPLGVWFAKPDLGRVAVAIGGVVILVLSQVRTAWLGGVIIAALLLTALPPSQRLRTLLLALVAAVLCTVTAIRLQGVSDVAATRFETLKDPFADTSAMSRLEGHSRAVRFSADHPAGVGIGIYPEEIEKYIGIRDSLFTAALIQFGIAGALLYVGAMVMAFGQLWIRYRTAMRLESMALAGVGIGLLLTAPFSTVTSGPQGILAWSLIGVAIAANPLRERSTAAIADSTHSGLPRSVAEGRPC